MRFPPIRHSIICFLGFLISEYSVDKHKNRSFDTSIDHHILSWYASKLLQMTLPVLSAQSITNQLVRQNHAFQGPSCSYNASLRLNLKFSDSIGGIGLTSSVFDYHLIRLKLKHKGSVTKNHVIYASQNENGELERGNPKPYTDDDILKSVFLSHGNNLCQEDLDVKVHEADPPSNLNINEHVVNYPVNQGNLLDRLKAVQLHVLASEQWNASRIKLCHRHYVESATNLIHYLALKCLDVEDLKEELSSVGLLNLETINPYVIASISAGIKMLENLKYISFSSKENMDSIALDPASAENISTLDGPDKREKGEITITAMRKKALSHSAFLLGPLRDGKTTHIMVTVGKEATESDTLINDLLNAGATTMRINCAHGDPSIWSEIIQRIRRSSHLLEKPCRILMDLAGPKLRTGQMKAGPSVMKISPKRNASGSVIVPAQVWLSHKDAGPPPAHLSPDKVLFVDNQEFLSSLKVGDTLRFYDTRGRKRALKISKGFPVFSGIGFMAECMRTAYVESGTTLYTKGKKGRGSVGTVVNVPAVEQFVRLQTGDLLIISRELSLTTKTESEGSTVGAPRITCPSSYLFDSVKPGERIAFDDGKIWGVIQGTSSSEIVVSITHAGLKGSKLGSEKSINIPESEIRFEGLTSKDIVDLEFVAEHADMVGISFIRDVRDIVVIQQELEKLKHRKLGVVLKIETQRGFEKLPLLLLQAMQFPNPLGVMIARGDLAVECGWEKLADMQDEILSVCGAAHIPVIWATQVLESLVKSGLPTRAEITDVANGRRASCIMLNKGKYITGAVSTLDSILHNRSKKMRAEVKPLLLSKRLN